MNKLTQQEAQDLIQKAWHMVAEHHLVGYRFGQALWNIIPNDIYQKYSCTDKDFFYWQDSDKVTETFFKYFVQEN